MVRAKEGVARAMVEEAKEEEGLVRVETGLKTEAVMGFGMGVAKVAMAAVAMATAVVDSGLPAT